MSALETEVAGSSSQMPAPPTLAMYLAAYAVALCGVYTASVGLAMGDSTFLSVVTGLITVGFTVSFATRSVPSAGWSVAALMGSLIGVAALRAVSSQAGLWLYLGADSGDVHRNLGVLLCWLLVLLSFAQISAGWLLFVCVPTGAILGLVGTAYTEIDFLIVFILYLFLASFLLVHDQHARVHAETAVRGAKAASRGRLLGQVYTAVICACGAIIMGRLLESPVAALVNGRGLDVGSSDARSASSPSSTSRVAVFQQDELRVGTGGNPSSEVVIMRVRAEHGAYWRGGTFDYFSGSGWRSTLPMNHRVPARPTRGEPSAMFDPRERASVELRVPRTRHNRVPGSAHLLVQYVYLEPGAVFTELYGAAEPLYYRLPEQVLGGVPVPSVANDAGRLSLPRSIGGTGYEVVSRVADWTPDTLRATKAIMDPDLMRMYTQVSLDAKSRERLTALARRVTKKAGTDFDRVAALSAYIGRTCRYNKEAEPFDPDGPDVVTQFVFDRREGYCDAFATTLAVLCRTLGIPARVASGFPSGTFDTVAMEYVIRDSDRHLWTEVWFAGVGWVPFDATEGAQDVTPRTAADRLLHTGDWLRRVLVKRVLPFLLGAAALLLLLIVIAAELSSRLGLDLPTLRRAQPKTYTDEILRCYDALERYLDRQGLRRLRWQTLREFAAELAQALQPTGMPTDGLRELMLLTERVRYSGIPASHGEVLRARRLLKEIITELRRERISGDRNLDPTTAAS